MSSERRIIISPVAGMCLIVVGALFLFGQLFHIGVFWPLFIVVPGGVCLLVAVTGGRCAAPLAIPGMLITGTGTILLYQSMTHHWQSWAYVWTLYPALLGGGMVLMGRLTNDHKAFQIGRMFIIGGLGAFVVFGVLFEMVIFHHAFAGLVWPLILIALGVGLLLSGTQHRKFHL